MAWRSLLHCTSGRVTVVSSHGRHTRHNLCSRGSRKKKEFFWEVVWSGEVRVVVAAPFEVRAHGVGLCEIIFLLGFCGVLEFVWSGFVSSFEMQGMGLGPRPPSIPISNAVVDDPEVGKFYWIYLKYLHDLNDDSPVSIPIPPSSDLEWHSIQAPSSGGNARTASRHCGLLIHFDSMTKIGALFLGSGQRQPQQPHRFIPWYGTLRLPRQPPDPLVPDPPGAFDQFLGFLNFFHLIQARVLQRSEVGVGTFIPGLVYVNEIVAGDILHTYLPGDSMAYLKELHDRYWAGIRYNDVGDTILPGSGGGPSGDGGSSGGHGSMTRSMTSGASGQGQASGK